MRAKKAPEVKPNWWSTLPGLLTALGGAIAAVAGLVTALKGAGIIGAPAPVAPTPSDLAQPASSSQPKVGDPNSDPPIDAPMMGTTGWIYVGTRVRDQWKTTPQEGREPARTLRTEGIPVRGMTYEVERGVNIRELLPTAKVPGERPQMTKSKGTIDNTYKVKIDDVREMLLTNPTRTWVWAHITVAGRN
jgi:hypothetical protein